MRFCLKRLKHSWGFLDRGVLSTPLELRLCLAIPEASGEGAETATQRAPATGLFADAE